MKEDTHPDKFRPVIFHDTTSGERFLFKSTVETDETDEWEDGEEYPLTRIEMSSASHPFYTGVEKVVDTAGRVEKFEARFEKAQEKQNNEKANTVSNESDTEETAETGDDEPEPNSAESEGGVDAEEVDGPENLEEEKNKGGDDGEENQPGYRYSPLSNQRGFLYQ